MNVIVKPSLIHGKGVFANKNFKKGEAVIKCDVFQILIKEEVDKLPEKEKHYVSYLNGRYVLIKGPGKYVNHSCDANTDTKGFIILQKEILKRGRDN